MTSSLDRFTRNSYPGVICAAVILLLTGLPGSFLPKQKPIFGLDKIAPLLMYLGFAFLCLWGYRKQFISNGKEYKKRAMHIALVVSIAYGGLTELMQEYLVPLRIGDWRDFIADCIGTLLGVTFFYLFYRHKK